MKIINAHTHFWKSPALGLENVTILDLHKEMKANKIDTSIVIGGKINPELLTNQESIDVIEKYKVSDSFKVIAGIDIREDLGKQKKEIEELFKQTKIVGVKVYLGYQHIFVNDKLLEPFYELCEKYDFPIMFHTGDTLYETAKLKFSHPLQIDELAVDNPKLKIIMAHCGNPWIIDAMEVLYKNENVYADISGFFYYETQARLYPLMKAKMNDLINYEAGHKLLFGTDFPLTPAKPYIDFTKSLDFTKKELELTMHGNAEKLFKL